MNRTTLLLLALVGCAQADSSVPPLGRPASPSVRAFAVPGDTLGYVVTWPAVSAASTYDFSVSAVATNGTWAATFGSTPVGALPAAGNTVAGPVVVKLSAIPWDSATFTFSYRARHVPARSSADTSVFVGSTWKIVRRLGTPLPPTVTPDSNTLKVTGLLVRPDTIRLLAGQSRQACPFIQFADGKIAVAEGQVYHALCDSLALRVFTAAQRAVTLAQQVCADSGGTYCATSVGSLREWHGQFVILGPQDDVVQGEAVFRLDGQARIMMAAR